MLFINCKVELKLRWKNKCALAVAIVEYYGADSENNFYYERHKAIFLRALNQQKTIKIYQHFSAMGLKVQCIGINMKEKVKTKTLQQMYIYFLESNFASINRFFVRVYLNRDNDLEIFKS